MYGYGVIGNCQINALISDEGSIDWLCLPRPDSPPIFGKILDPEGGSFSIRSSGSTKGVQRYLDNTNVLETVFHEKDGTSYKITDFCPRFIQYGRIFHPPMLIRVVTPLSGSPTIRVQCKPVDGWSRKPTKVMQGSSHLRFLAEGDSGDQLRLTTDMPLTYLNQGAEFTFHEPLYFALTWGVPFHDNLKSTIESFLQQTELYWKGWVKHCNIPTLFQNEVIRSALILKLHCFEDTGAILASLTTSLPEETLGVRNWDYRFCWLRDAYFSLTAFHSLGHFEEMEGFIRFLLNVAHQSKEEGLRPVYCLDNQLPLPEIVHENWAGFDGSKPVRSGNQAATHVQNDVYGEMILSLAPAFFDDRFMDLRSGTCGSLLNNITSRAIRFLEVPDAGLWEFRDTQRLHSFSLLLTWVGLERMERLVKTGKCRYDIEKILNAKVRAEELISKCVIDGSLRNSADDASFDASLALAGILRFNDKELCRKTVREIYDKLALKEEGKASGFFYRYLRKDDFGKPQSAFLACSFWVASGLAAAGDLKLARAVIERTLESQNHLGLFSEHYDPYLKKQLGNFPQAYSHVGLINSVFAVSPPWSEVL